MALPKNDSDPKACTKCGEMKRLTEYHAAGYYADGTVRHHPYCKPCRKNLAAATVNTEPKACAICKLTKPASEFAVRGTCAYCRPCANAKIKAQTQGPGREAHNARVGRKLRELKERDPEAHRKKQRARLQAWRAVQAGTLIRPDSCPRCGVIGMVQSHHHKGYEPEHALDVEWLCAKCHFAEDGGMEQKFMKKVAT